MVGAIVLLCRPNNYCTRPMHGRSCRTARGERKETRQTIRPTYRQTTETAVIHHNVWCSTRLAACILRAYNTHLASCGLIVVIRSQADPPLRRAGRSPYVQAPRTTLLCSLVRSDLRATCQPAHPRGHGAQIPPVVGSARSSILPFRNQADSDSSFLGDAWYCGPICIQPGQARHTLSRAGPSRTETHRKVFVSETPHNCRRVGEGKEEEKKLDSRRKICTHGPTD